MKALYKSKSGPGLILVERPEPIPGASDVKIRVMRTGICGTDLHIDSWDAWAFNKNKTRTTFTFVKGFHLDLLSVYCQS